MDRRYVPNVNETRRAILARLSEGPVTGPDLAERLEVSRTAVWKHIEALREQGFEIDSEAAGYRLETVPEYGSGALEYRLPDTFDIEFHEQISSTNERARERAREGASNVVVVADEQTAGRGRLDRAWASPSGGIWMSILLRPEDPPAEMPLRTLAAAVAIADAAETRGVEAGLKWPNDVLAISDGRHESKLAGILTEMEGEANVVSWLVLGIGINANVDDGNLPAGATSLRALLEDVDRARFVADVLERFDDLRSTPDDIVTEWAERSLTLGSRVRVSTGEDEIVGEAVDIESPGRLQIDTGHDRVWVHTGDCEHLRRN